MKQAKVSILMTACNAERYIAMYSINSCARFLDWELIVIDDFSTDRTFQILQNLQSKMNELICSKSIKGIIPALALAFSRAKDSS
ncbi:MAG: glycosyltransferase family 2 protein [Crocinitomicaceae bacterium]|nr:glycosyltransferase family 2 protein [Crocinitomicaceae bacterium]